MKALIILNILFNFYHIETPADFPKQLTNAASEYACAYEHDAGACDYICNELRSTLDDTDIIENIPNCFVHLD